LKYFSFGSWQVYIPANYRFIWTMLLLPSLLCIYT
jgi:hypothetical protein